VTPIILSFDCTDYDPIDSWIFPEPKSVDFWMNFTIGLDQSGGNDFQLHVLTSDMVASNTSLSNAIVLDCYTWDTVLLKVNAILDQCSGENWEEISIKLSKHMAWEYENYHTYSS
jgi:hypothetical protein